MLSRGWGLSTWAPPCTLTHCKDGSCHQMCSESNGTEQEKLNSFQLEGRNHGRNHAILFWEVYPEQLQKGLFKQCHINLFPVLEQPRV